LKIIESVAVVHKMQSKQLIRVSSNEQSQFLLAVCWRQYKWAMIYATVVALGAFQVGFHLGYSSPTEESISTAANVSFDQAEFIFSVMNIGAVLGCFIAAPISDAFGRVKAMMFASVPVAVCSATMAFISPTFVSLLVSRIGIGLGVGIYSVVVPVYIVEIAPTEVRGLLGTINEFMLYFGILFVTLIGIGCAGEETWWRAMLYFAMAFAILTFFLMMYCPETPRWLLSKGRIDEAEKSVQNIFDQSISQNQDYFAIIAAARSSAQIERSSLEVAESKQNFETQRDTAGHIQIKDEAKNEEVSIAVYIRKRGAWTALLLGCAIQALKQFSGIYAVQFYAVQMFETAASSFAIAIGATAALYFFVVLMLFFALIKIESFKRKTAIIASLIGMAFWSYLIAGFGDMIDVSGYGILWKSFLFIGYLGSFALGIGPISWIFCSEIFPCRVRSMFMSIATAAHWFCAFIITATFSQMVSIFGTNDLFWIYGSCCILGVFFVHFLLPETQGRSLEEIELDLQKTEDSLLSQSHVDA
jgi:MFS family permease